MAQEAGPVGALPPPPGQVPNFDDPEDVGRTSLTVGLAVMAGITTVMFGLRSYAKMTISPHWHPEDWTCLVAYGLWMCYISTVLVMSHYGEGYHEWEVTKESYKEILRWLYIGSIVYCPAAYLTKVTLLLFEARIFTVYERVSKGIYAFIAALLVCYLPIMLLKAVVCVPIPAAWDAEVKPASCLNQRKVFICDMCLGIFTDLVILLLPLALTFSLQMPVWTKVKVVALLSAGGVATGVSIYRLYKSILFLNPIDNTEGFVLLDLTTALELAIGLVCACLPAVNLLIQRTTELREMSPNRPRRSRGEAKPGHAHIAYWHLWTWTKRSKMSSTEGSSSIGRVCSSGSPPSLDRTSTDGRWSYDPRATSLDGRREGWLRQDQGNKNVHVRKLYKVPTKTSAIEEMQSDWEEAWNRKLRSERLASAQAEQTNAGEIV